MGTRRHGVGIKLYINNLLGWDLGTWVGGDLGTRRQGVGIKVYINNLLGWDLGTLGLGGDLCPLALQHASYLLLAAVYLGSAT